MSYVALYRKHRSKNFDEILGQEHVTNTLKNQISNDKIAHAYLLCGIRGVGKTSIARILAKAVNCENPVNGNPCGQCEMCKAIENSSNLNVIEIDAASNTGVDNIKEIRDDAAYMPSKGKYKVYIIDEVHMLSNNAFNALLKILEEPPKHVIFIFATTESQKIPATILSRCQRFDLKRITRDAMVDRIKEYLKEENVNVEEKAIKYIVSLSEGSMRDALSILEQVLSIKRGEEVTLEDILNTLGNVNYTTFHNLTKSISDKDVVNAIEIVNKIYEDGKEIRNFVVQFITYLRNLLLIVNSSNAADVIDMSEENVNEIRQLSKELKSYTIIRLIETLSKTEADMKYSNMPKLLLEITIIKLCENQEQQVQQMYQAQLVQHSQQREQVQPEVKINNSVNNVQTPEIPQAPREEHVVNKVETEVKENVNVSTNTNINVNITSNEDTKKVVPVSNNNDAINVWKKVRDGADQFTRVYLEKTVVTKVTENEYYVLCDNDALKERVDSKVTELTALLEKNGVTGKRLIFYVEEDLQNVQKENNSPKIDENNINEIADNFANLGIDVNFN